MIKLKNIDMTNSCEIGEPFYDEYGFMIGCLEKQTSDNFTTKIEVDTEDQKLNKVEAGTLFLEKKKDRLYNNSFAASQFVLIDKIELSNKSLWEKEGSQYYCQIKLSDIKHYENFYLQIEVLDQLTKEIIFIPGAPVCDGTNQGSCNSFSSDHYQAKFTGAFLNLRSNQISFASHDHINQNMSTNWLKCKFNFEENKLKIFNELKYQNLNYEDFEYEGGTSNEDTFIGKTQKINLNNQANLKINIKIFGIENNSNSGSQPYKILSKIEAKESYESSALINNNSLNNYKQGYKLTKSATGNSFTYINGKNTQLGESNSYCINHTPKVIYNFRSEIKKETTKSLANGNLLTNNSFNDYDFLIANLNYNNSELILNFDSESEFNLATTFYDENDAISWLVFQLNETGNIELVQKWKLIKTTNNSFKLDYENSFRKDFITNELINHNNLDLEFEQKNTVTVNNIYGFKKTVLSNDFKNTKLNKQKNKSSMSAKEKLN